MKKLFIFAAVVYTILAFAANRNHPDRAGSLRID